MSDSIEKSLHHLVEKEDFITWVKSLPEGVKILALASTTTETCDLHKHWSSDNVNILTANWMMDCYKFFLQTATKM